MIIETLDMAIETRYIFRMLQDGSSRYMQDGSCRSRPLLDRKHDPLRIRPKVEAPLTLLGRGSSNPQRFMLTVEKGSGTDRRYRRQQTGQCTFPKTAPLASKHQRNIFPMQDVSCWSRPVLYR